MIPSWRGKCGWQRAAGARGCGGFLPAGNRPRQKNESIMTPRIDQHYAAKCTTHVHFRGSNIAGITSLIHIDVFFSLKREKNAKIRANHVAFC